MENLTEVVGYAASLGVLLSFLMKDLKTLRIVNTIGCLLFVLYGVLLHYSYPVILTNVSIIGINLYYLTRKV
ncbi:MAG: uroporphyrinogen decarboxylase [Chitinophagales bacterium]